ncbi:MerR family transcriptional regulator [Actinomycetospora cinnamomea]|uniref:DNA-binding transcriptional MerR regulator n=1 Tax=Actinomycetospora cinnamomea TaxID=663609 RepID=A0A2U1EU47_9PSEU|nr:MerR family transcriptional regulator [Actinomycetospora cinnamomea]PVZ03458.1 DNA-binding transcriptional MerR regulator [Actinomycetospora cinnamomea]
MTAAGLSEPGGSPLSIGSVLDALRADFPEITISKIRFLESEGLIRPARTPAGYRQFSHADVARLRFVLSAQRDHYLPLKVIRAKLEEFDRDPSGSAGGAPALPGEGADAVLPGGPAADTGGPGGPGGPSGPRPGAGGPSAAATARVRSLASVADRVEPDDDPDGARGDRADTVGRDVLLAEDGVDAALLDGLEHHGILRPDADGRFEPEDVLVARTAASLARLGVEPRLLRSARASADREVGLLAQLVTPVARSRGPEAARRAEELSAELAALSGRLHALLVGAGLRHGLRR